MSGLTEDEVAHDAPPRRRGRRQRYSDAEIEEAAVQFFLRRGPVHKWLALTDFSASLGTASTYVQDRGFTGARVDALLRERVMMSAEYSRTGRALASMFVKVEPVQAEDDPYDHVRGLGEAMFDLALARLTNKDAPFSSLRGRLLWWALEVHRDDSREAMEHELTGDETDVALLYRELFRRLGLATSDDEQLLIPLVHQVSALFDGMLVRATISNPEEWKQRFVDGMVILVRGHADAPPP